MPLILGLILDLLFFFTLTEKAPTAAIRAPGRREIPF